MGRQITEMNRSVAGYAAPPTGRAWLGSNDRFYPEPRVWRPRQPGSGLRGADMTELSSLRSAANRAGRLTTRGPLRWAMLAAGLGLATGDAIACAPVRFTDKAAPMVAYNYDLHGGDGLVLVNPRGLAKTSILDGKPHSWTSRFGSLTFTQFGRDQSAPWQARPSVESSFRAGR